MLKVLIADDEEKVIQLIIHLVHWEEMDMEIVGAVSDGVEAYEMILEKRPDIVITDIRMPGISGIEMVEKVTKELDNIFFIIVSGYSEFEYAQHALKLGVEDYLLKPIRKKELEAVLHRILGKYRENVSTREERKNLLDHLQLTQEKVKNNFLWELIGSRRKSILQMDEEAIFREFGCRFRGKYFTHITAHLFTNTVMENNEEYGFLLPKIQKVMKEKLEDYCLEWMSIVHDEEIICMMNSEANREEEMRRQFLKIKIELSKQKAIFPDFCVVIAIGKTVEELCNYEESMNTADAAVRNRFGRAGEFVIEGTKPCPENAVQVSDFIDFSRKKDILTAMELLDQETFVKELQNIRDRLGGYLTNGQLIYNVYRELVEIFVFGVKNYFHAEVKITDEELMKGYMHLYGFEEVFGWLIRSCCEIMAQYAEIQHNQEARPVRLAKQYINDNYNKAINLENVSKYIGFNPAYFSSMFKKATGQNFMDYVIEVRILNARNLLVQTNQDVTDIARQVGYSDLKYFSKIFKKLTNLTPTEYRKLYS